MIGGEEDEVLPGEGAEGENLSSIEGEGVEPAEAPEDIVDPGEGNQPGQEPERPVSRAERRYQAIISENRRIKEDAERYRREADQYRQQEWQRSQQQQNDPAVMEQRIAAIEDPEQRINARLQWEQQKNQQALYQMRVQMFNQQDQAQLGSIIEKIPDAKKYSQQVEQMFNAQPQYLGEYRFTRTDILDKLLGQERRENALKGKEKAAAQQRVAQQRVAPTSSRGSVPATGSRNADPVAAARARLERGMGGKPVVFD